MKKYRVIFGILAALLLLSLTGCQALPKERTAAVLLAGQHGNRQKPNYDVPMEKLREVYESMGCASVVLVSGSPEVVSYDDLWGSHTLGQEEDIPNLEVSYRDGKWGDF